MRKPLSLVSFLLISLFPVGLAYGARCLLTKALNDEPIFAFFMFGVMLSGWLGGWLSSLCTTVASVIVVELFVLPDGSLSLTEKQSLVRLSLFVLNCLAAVVVFAIIRRSWRRSKEAQKRSESNEQRFRSLSDLMPQMVWETDSYGRVTYINQRLREAACIGSGDDLATWLRCLHPEDGKRFPVEFAKAFHLEQTFDFECRFRFPDGTYRWMLARATPFRDADGKIQRWLGTSTDIEEQKNLQAALRDGQTLFRQLAENIRDQVFYVTDVRKSAIIYVSPAYEKIWGRSVESLLRDRFSFLESIHPDDVQSTRELVQKMAFGDSSSNEYRVVRPDGSVRWILDRAFPVLNSEGELIRITGIAEDITDARQRQAEREKFAGELKEAKDAADRARVAAQAANEAKTRFLANMSHEIRTPLGAILGFAELMRESSQNEAERLESICTILRNGEQLSRVVNDILDLSKIESDRLEIEMLPINPLTIVEEVANLLSLKAKSKGLALQISSETPLPQLISTDPTRLRQILINVIGNAIKFTDQGRIDVLIRSANVAKPGELLLRFSVRDTGPGISIDQWSRLFQPFSQADVSTARVYGGSGLGLVLSKKLAQALGGDLQLVESTPGHGSEFEITIVAGLPKPSIAHENVTTIRTPQRSPCHLDLKVLLVDDVADNRVLVSRYLQDSGAKMDWAENGLEGVSAALAHPYDLVLMDLQMPRMDGYAALKELRERGYEGPIVALTAHAMRGYREQCLSAGFNDYLVKPLKKNVLLETLGQYSKSTMHNEPVLHH